MGAVQGSVFGGGVRIDQNSNTEKIDFLIFHDKNLDFSGFSIFWYEKVVFSRNERAGERIGAGNLVAARKNDLSQLFQPVARSYDKITSFQSAPTVRISARKPGFGLDLAITTVLRTVGALLRARFSM